MMTCVVCDHAAMRSDKDAKTDRTRREMARQGMVCCTLSPHAASFYALTATCDRFAPADPATATARMAWADKHHGQASRP